MGFEQTDGPELKLKKLEAGLRHAVETSQEELALYARLLSISKPKSDPSFDVTPQRQKDLTINALCRRLQSLAAKRPLIIVLADAHWIDSSTLELVDKLIPLIKTARVLFAIEFRLEFSPRWLNEPDVTLLHLDRLGSLGEQVEELLLEVASFLPQCPAQLRGERQASGRRERF